MTASLPRSLPESQGVSSSAVLSFLDGIERDIKELHGFMLLRHGAVIAEGWWRPYGPDTSHMLFSLSKSFTSTAVGLAVGEGRLSVDDGVLSFFPDDAPARVSENLAAMRVRHLLTMTTGHDKDATDATFGRRDHRAEKAFLSLAVPRAPGTHFVYNSAATYMLSAIVQKLTGQTVLDYLTPRLFEPLGIHGSWWDSYVNGVNFGGFGLSVRTEEIARFGQLYLNRGLWNGRRILAESWIAEATARQVPNGEDADSDWTQGYGYQFWRCKPRGVYRGDGAFGQFCVVMPEQDAVMAITSGVGDMQAVLTRIWQKLLPGMDGLSAMGVVPGADLKQRLAMLRLDPPAGAQTSGMATAVSGREYALEPNEAKLTSVRFDLGVEGRSLTIKRGQKRSTLALGHREWCDGMLLLPPAHARAWRPAPVYASGAWTAEDTFVVTIREIRSPFVYTLTFRFAGDELLFDREANVAFGPVKAPQVRGRAP
jgi:CubicO group peptidase (beta-lactamase class C family)